MLVMNQSRDKLINLNNATSIELTTLEDGYTSEICVYLIDDAPETLGEYNTKDRAKEVLKKITDIQGGAGTYCMPEEQKMIVLKCNQSTADSVFQDIIKLKNEMKQLKWYEFKKRGKYKRFIAFNEALYHFKLYGGEK